MLSKAFCIKKRLYLPRLQPSRSPPRLDQPLSWGTHPAACAGMALTEGCMTLAWRRVRATSRMTRQVVKRIWKSSPARRRRRRSWRVRGQDHFHLSWRGRGIFLQKKTLCPAMMTRQSPLWEGFLYSTKQMTWPTKTSSHYCAVEQCYPTLSRIEQKCILIGTVLVQTVIRNRSVHKLRFHCLRIYCEVYCRQSISLLFWVYLVFAHLFCCIDH